MVWCCTTLLSVRGPYPCGRLNGSHGDREDVNYIVVAMAMTVTFTSMWMVT